jgi:hypothetical protein
VKLVLEGSALTAEDYRVITETLMRVAELVGSASVRIGLVLDVADISEACRYRLRLVEQDLRAVDLEPIARLMRGAS